MQLLHSLRGRTRLGWTRTTSSTDNASRNLENSPANERPPIACPMEMPVRAYVQFGIRTSIELSPKFGLIASGFIRRSP
jgi:hypothetical protein